MEWFKNNCTYIYINYLHFYTVKSNKGTSNTKGNKKRKVESYASTDKGKVMFFNLIFAINLSKYISLRVNKRNVLNLDICNQSPLKKKMRIALKGKDLLDKPKKGIIIYFSYLVIISYY